MSTANASHGAAITGYRPPSSFYVGFELEVVLGLNLEMVKDSLAMSVPEEQSWDTVAKVLCELFSRMLSEAKLPKANINAAMVGDYSGLSIVQDASIRSSGNPAFQVTDFPIEFVSPAFQVHSKDLSAFITTFTDILYSTTHCQTDNSTCGLHVHISPERSAGELLGWQLDELKAIACAIIAFDPTIDALVPEFRRINNSFTASNIFAKKVAADLATPGHYGTAFDRIAGFNAIEPLIDYISTDNRVFAWDFGHLVRDCGTIEFRRPASTTDEFVIRAWIDFLAMFTLAAVSPGGRTIVQSFRRRATRAKTRELYDFLSNESKNPQSNAPMFANNNIEQLLFRDTVGNWKEYDYSMTATGGELDSIDIMELRGILEMKKRIGKRVAAGPVAKP